MELFKFISPADPTVLVEAVMINGATSIMWTERYREAGEFEIVAKLSSGLLDFLPLGTLISHVNTFEVMFVENQEIAEDIYEDPSIKITGRSLDAFLENRIVGMNLARSNVSIVDYTLGAGYTWLQVVTLINNHIISGLNPNDNLVNVQANHNITGTGISEARAFKRTTVHATVLEMLAIDDLGIKSIRRNNYSYPGSLSGWTTLLVHQGIDQTANVIISWKAGDLDKVGYLWSDKKNRNSAIVLGRYYNVVVDTPGYIKYARRTMIVDGSDIDAKYPTFVNEGEASDILGKMYARGRQAIAAQNRVTITRSDISNISKYQYRRDFNIGDMVMLDGNFGTIARMRVIEYVEIQDETGESGHPTLEVPEVHL